MDDEPHPRTQMLDMLEAIRVVIKRRPRGVSEAQVLAVLASAMEDHAGVAFASLSRRADPIPKPGPADAPFLLPDET